MKSFAANNQQYHAACMWTFVLALTLLAMSFAFPLKHSHEHLSSRHGTYQQISLQTDANIMLTTYIGKTKPETKGHLLATPVRNAYILGSYLFAACLITLAAWAWLARKTNPQQTLTLPLSILFLFFTQIGIGLFSAHWIDLQLALVIHFCLATFMVGLLWVLALRTDPKPRPYNYTLRNIRPFAQLAFFLSLAYLIINIWQTMYLATSSWPEQAINTFYPYKNYFDLALSIYLIPFTLLVISNPKFHQLKSASILTLCAFTMGIFVHFYNHHITSFLALGILHMVFAVLLLVSQMAILFKLSATPWKKSELIDKPFV